MPATLENIKALRAETDAPYKDCVQALNDTNDNMDEARKRLREMGKANTRSAETKEGYIAFAQNDKHVALLVANCETDFVSRNAEFRRMMDEAVQKLLDDTSISFVNTQIDEACMKFKENIWGRSYIGPASAVYVHHDAKRAAVVQYEGDNAEAARKIAIQVVAGSPKVVSASDVDQELVDEIVAKAKADAIASGKSEQIAENIAKGKLANVVKEIALLEQPMYDNPKQSVGEFAKANGIKLKDFNLFVAGN